MKYLTVAGKIEIISIYGESRQSIDKKEIN